MKWINFLFAIAFTFSFVYKAHAADQKEFVSCNGCSYSDMKRLAQSRSRPANQIPLNEVYTTSITVADFDNGSIFNWEVSWELIRKPPSFMEEELIIREVKEVSTVRAVEHNFYRVYEAKEAMKSSRVEVPPSVAGSAYDLVGASYLQFNVSKYMYENFSLIQEVGVGAGAIIRIFFNDRINLGELFATASFSDGSTATFRLVGFDDIDRPQFEFRRGRDVDGNYISAHSSGYVSGAYSFKRGGVDALNRFIDAAMRVGIRIGAPSGSVSLGPLMLCSVDDDHGDYLFNYNCE
ncbi:hypothetical protein [Marinobacter sp. CA1]|uniref:hypothetical protein n=1 Tax=Marinobacter sp. CA1 TaxID=2817656 RepID=UPI001D087B0D|nr:hypothetical protein [Marinobacter sp. CA1]UDL05591.1 hypothetical protein J2887_02115 [Marinobacter sp. CA1]